MRPAFDEGIAAENLLDLGRGRSVQMQELHVMPGISLVNRDDIGGVIVERGQPFVLLLLRPVAPRPA